MVWGLSDFRVGQVASAWFMTNAGLQRKSRECEYSSFHRAKSGGFQTEEKEEKGGNVGSFAFSAVVIIGAIDFAIAEHCDWLARPRRIADSSRWVLAGLTSAAV